MRNVILAAIREYKATALTKAFLFGVVIAPALIGGAIWLVVTLGLFAEKPAVMEGTIAVADGTPGQVFAEGIEKRLGKEAQEARQKEKRQEMQQAMDESPASDMMPGGTSDMALDMAERLIGLEAGNVTITALPIDADLEELKQQVLSGEMLAVAHIPPKLLDEPGDEYELFVGPEMDRKIADRIREAIQETVIDARINTSGLEPDRVFALVKAPQARTVTVSETGEEESKEWAQFVVPIVFIMLLLTAVFTSGQYLLMSTIEEKSSRVMEVVLSAMTPMQLMAGKILGQGMVGLTVLLVYGGLGIVAAVQFDQTGIIPMNLLPLLAVYFVLAYFMIASVFAAVGSAVTEMREASSLLGPVWMIIIIPIYMVFFNIDNPNSTFNKVASFFPPTTPFVMPVRLSQPGANIPMWEIAVTLILCAAGVALAVWTAAKIFRIGVLMYGKPPTLVGLVKWVRQG